MLAFSEFCQAVGISEDEAAPWAPGWQESQHTFRPGCTHFLTETFVDATSRQIGMSDEVRRVLLEARPDIASNPMLQRLAWHCWHRMYETPGLLEAGVHKWPLLPRNCAPMSDMFLAFIVLAGVPQLRARYDRRGLPDGILNETMADLELWIREHRSKTGRWGFSEHKWLIHHLAANLFQLGRLQFQFGTYRYDYVAWRHRQTRQVIVFPNAELTVDADGFPAPGAPNPAFLSVYAETPDAVSGTPILPQGTIQPEVLTIPRRQYDVILRRDDPVINLHIPAGGGMTPRKCGESFRGADHFFKTYFHDRPFRAYACTSWLLDPQLQEYLSPDSNLVSFQRELYLTPVPSPSDRQIQQRVLGGIFEPPHAAPQETSLQRAVVKHLAQGRTWRSGACLLFPEDLDWGGQLYRRQTPPGHQELKGS